MKHALRCPPAGNQELLPDHIASGTAADASTRADGQEQADLSPLIWLSSDAWEAIAPLLPYGRPGAPRVDDHRIVSGIVFVLVSGCRWQDCPPEYGPATTVYNRFARWSRRGFWQEVLNALSEAGVHPAKAPAAQSRRRLSSRK